MEQKINSHVERLHRYLPFSPSHDQIYEEYQTNEDSMNLDTVALQYLLNSVESGSKLIILTGDAGHGKTHLCRRLLQKYLNFTQEEAFICIVSRCDGSEPILDKNGRAPKLPLRVYKDFSEIVVHKASDALEEALNRDETTIICANEGRLRAVLESGRDKPGCAEVSKIFLSSFQNGLASQDGRIHIINLNYQSIASDMQESFLSLALKAWVDGRRWTICDSCSSNKYCPINFNRSLFDSSKKQKNESKLVQVELLFATAERLGKVITIREILMAIAYFLTGGLACSDVHHKLTSRKVGWQHEYVFYNLLFDGPKSIDQDKLNKISVLKELSQLDPGKNAIREIDEMIINAQSLFQENAIDLTFRKIEGGSQNVDASNGIDDIIGSPQSKKDRDREAGFVQLVIRSLRRKVFLESLAKPDIRMPSLGFEYGSEFLSILGSDMRPSERKSVKNRVVSGLHTIQGLQVGQNQTTLYIVDPSFSSASIHASIIAKEIVTTNISIIPMKDAWSNGDLVSEHKITSTVDWLDRYFILRVDLGNDEFEDFQINLMVYECIARAGSGYVAEEFYAHDLRRVRAFLGKLASKKNSIAGNISLFLNGRMRQVSIDDGIIQVSGES